MGINSDNKGKNNFFRSEALVSVGKQKGKINLLDMFSFCNPHRPNHDEDDSDDDIEDFGIRNISKEPESARSSPTTLASLSSGVSFDEQQRTMQEQPVNVAEKPTERQATRQQPVKPATEPTKKVGLSRPCRRVLFPKQKSVKEIVEQIDSPKSEVEIKATQSHPSRTKVKSMVKKIDSGVKVEFDDASKSTQTGKMISEASTTSWLMVIFSILLLVAVFALIFVTKTKSREDTAAEFKDFARHIEIKLKDQELWVQLKEKMSVLKTIPVSTMFYNSIAEAKEIVRDIEMKLSDHELWVKLKGEIAAVVEKSPLVKYYQESTDSVERESAKNVPVEDLSVTTAEERLEPPEKEGEEETPSEEMDQEKERPAETAQQQVVEQESSSLHPPKTFQM